MTAFFNTGLTQQQFLTQYWQKKPLLIRQAWQEFVPVISTEELAGLACEEDIESRLIEEHGKSGQWSLRHGPFTEADFAALPDTHWTLLVQDVDKHVPQLADVMNKFNFIPDWRRDDLMVSFAPEGGSVGPHTDGYDVFLLQAKGIRRWQISDNPVFEAEFIDGLDLKILKSFEADETWELQPGDMLYLPPHFAHHGVALNDCMTFSIGFRAPTQVELLDAFMHTLTEHEKGQQRYRDPGLLEVEDDKYIDIASLRRFKQSLISCIEQSDSLVLDAVGQLLTETKPSLELLADELIPEDAEATELAAQFERGQVLIRNTYLRMAWADNESQADEIVLYAAGERYKLEAEARPLMPLLTGNNPIHTQQWQFIQQYSSVVTMLKQLVSMGCWYWQQTD
jgi:50S ribosomal protein L16 3-hydroxylase